MCCLCIFLRVKSTADAAVPCNESKHSAEQVELTSSGSDKSGAEAETANAAKMTNPLSLVDLASQCVGTGTVKRAWADSPMEPAVMPATSGLCYDLDPTPQEAAAAAAAASASQKPTPSDSGGEDSAKENKESAGEKSDSGKGSKKKGCVAVTTFSGLYLFI